MTHLQTFESYKYSEFEMVNEEIMDFFKKIKAKFTGQEEELKNEIEDKLGVDENSSKSEVGDKVKEMLDGETTKEGILDKAKRIGGILGQVIEWAVYIYVYWQWGHSIWVVIAFVVWFFIRYKVLGKKKS